jgi:hypothetical protein
VKSLISDISVITEVIEHKEIKTSPNILLSLKSVNLFTPFIGITSIHLNHPLLSILKKNEKVMLMNWKKMFEGRFLALMLSLLAAAILVGLRDLIQTRPAILGNYPIIRHLRFFFEKAGHEIRQHFFEGDTGGHPQHGISRRFKTASHLKMRGRWSRDLGRSAPKHLPRALQSANAGTMFAKMWLGAQSELWVRGKLDALSPKSPVLVNPAYKLTYGEDMGPQCYCTSLSGRPRPIAPSARACRYA